MKTSASLLLAADVAIAGLTWYIIQTRRWKKIAEAAEAAPAPPPAAEANDVSSVGACCPRKSKKGANGNGGSSTTLVPATFAESYKLEYSIHRPSALLRNDIELVFRPDLDDVYHSDPRGKAAGLSKDDFLKAHLLGRPWRAVRALGRTPAFRWHVEHLERVLLVVHVELLRIAARVTLNDGTSQPPGQVQPIAGLGFGMSGGERLALLMAQRAAALGDDSLRERLLRRCAWRTV